MATAQDAAELKDQGAIEAAQNPNSSVTADQAQKQMMEDSKRAGVAAFTFDPDASPEEKRAQAKAAIPEELRHSRKPKGVAIVTDVDDGTGKVDYALPSPSKIDVVENPKDKDGREITDGNTVEEEEDLAAKLGWTSRMGWPTETVLSGDSMLDHSTWLESKIPDQFYGDWYHNAAIIMFACIFSWLIAVLGGGLGWVIILMAGCSTYYRTSIRRVRRNFRDDVIREMALKKLDTDHESLEWINSFLVKFWPIYQPVLAQTVINSVDQVLSTATPSFLDSLKLKTFTLGSKPPRMDHVKTYPKAEDDTVLMDWKFSFTPNDTADMTATQVKNKINPKVVLEIRIGKAMISKGLDVIVEDMAFSGIMRLKVKLQIPFPHVEKIEMCFLERPSIDYVCKPLGGETFGFDINFIPGLESFIQEQIHGNLAPMMYAPNVFPIEVAKMLAGSPVDQAIGVVAITLHGAQGLKNPDNFSGDTDPYAVVTLNKRAPLAQTKVVKDTGNPRWNETHYIIITTYNDSLDIIVNDFNDFRKDKELGVASFPLERLEDVTEYENERIEVIANGKARGVLSADIRFFPVLEEKTLPDGKVEPAPDSNTGILRYTVEQAKNLDGSKSLIGQLNPYACLLLNGKEVHTTTKLKRTNNPIWPNGSKEILITDRKHAKLGLAIKDERDLAGDQVIGTYQIKLDDMLEMMEKGHDWYNLVGDKNGRAKITAQWKPVALSGVLASSGGYQTPIGVMRLHFKAANDLRNFEAMGKSDPYARVLLSGIEKGRTVTHRNTLNPVWDEVLYVPVHSARDRLTIDVMDAEKMGKDRSLGSIEVFGGDYIEQDERGEYKVHGKKQMRNDGLRLHGKGIAKGTLNYSVSFYPCLNVADPEEEEEEAAEKAEQAKETASAGRQSVDGPRRSAEPGRFSAISESKDTNGTNGTNGTVRSAEPGKFSAISRKDTAKEKEQQPTPPSGESSSPTPERKSKDEGPPKLHLTPEELLKHESGFLIFKLLEGEMPQSNTHLEIFVDDMLYPSYVSSTAKGRRHKFDEIGDLFIRELDFSRLTLKLREKREKPGEERDEDHTIARLAGNTVETLKQCLNNPTILKLKDEQNRNASIKVSLKYIPVQMELDPSESINNMGNLRVDVLDGADLPAADRNGKSDPYAKFELNGIEVFKTKTQKKTLNPTWNEYFEIPVPSRTAAQFLCKVYDYDFADKPDLLGTTDINLEQLDPFKAKEVKLTLDGKSGSVRLRLLFRPDYITRARVGTSTFAGTFAVPGRIVTGVVGAPIKGGAAAVGVVGKGASFLKRGIRGKKEDSNGSFVSPSQTEIPSIITEGPESPAGGSGMRRATGLTETDDAPPPKTPNGPRTPHARTSSMGGASVHSMAPGGPGVGTATFTVVKAEGFPPSADIYVVIKQTSPKEKVIGKTKHHDSDKGAAVFEETFKCATSADTGFRIEVKEHHTFGSDDDLGQGLYFVDESGSGEKELKVGEGTVFLRSSFVENNADSSPRGGMRRSFLSKREPRLSRESTPV